MKKHTPLSLCRFVLVLGATVAFCAYAVPAADDVRMPSIYTVPHELDCLLKAGHIQGACCSEKAIYLSHQLGICKIGWDGKLIHSVEAPAHLGDTAYADGKIYGAFVIRSKALRKDGKKGLVRVVDKHPAVFAVLPFDGLRFFLIPRCAVNAINPLALCAVDGEHKATYAQLCDNLWIETCTTSSDVSIARENEGQILVNVRPMEPILVDFNIVQLFLRGVLQPPVARDGERQ